MSNAGLSDERVDDGDLFVSFLSVYHQIPGDQRLRENSYFALVWFFILATGWLVDLW